jgi:hypothetical protein
MSNRDSERSSNEGRRSGGSTTELTSKTAKEATSTASAFAEDATGKVKQAASETAETLTGEVKELLNRQVGVARTCSATWPDRPGAPRMISSTTLPRLPTWLAAWHPRSTGTRTGYEISRSMRFGGQPRTSHAGNRACIRVGSTRWIFLRCER